MAELVKPKVAPKKRASIKKKTALEAKNKRSVSKKNPARVGMRGWLLLAVVVIGAGILIYASGRDSQDIVKAGEDVVQVTEKSGKASIGGAFELTDHNGNLVTNKTFKGKVESISSRIDPSTRSILARIIVNNSNFEIIPGQLMTVKIIYDEINQIGVPESAVTIQGNTAFVYIVNSNIVEKKNIKMGKRNFGKVSIVSGINEGDMVISEGVSKVRNKAKVKIINP